MKYFEINRNNKYVALSSTFLLFNIFFQVGTVHAEKEADNTVNVTVTGSRISKAAKDGANSITVIKASDIEREGFSNAYEALNNFSQNTGTTQGSDAGNTYTPTANTISLKGLGPNHTLILINGHRVADYPTAYDGAVNFVNLANIPSAIIDRIEILSNGASAIYGSDAIAGVVNIILKKATDGTQINFKTGGTQQGGGENGRLQLTGSKEWNDHFNTVYAVELSTRKPIWAKDRDFMSNTSLLGEKPRNIAGRKDAVTGAYLPIGGCTELSKLFSGTVTQYGRTDNCASSVSRPTYWTIQTKNKSENLYLGNTYTVNDNLEFFAEGLLGLNQMENNTRGPSWTSLSATQGYFLNQNSGNYEIWNRSFAPEEIGGVNAINSKWNDLSANINLGVRGNIADTSWKYETSYTGSIYTSEITRKGRLLANVDNYFLGKQLGTDASGIPIYSPDISKINTPLTANLFNTISGATVEKDKSWSQSLNFSTTGNVFKLPKGQAKLALIAELGRQGFTIKPDSNLSNNVFYNANSQGGYDGIRDRQALGAELYLPLLTNLSSTLSGRYDRYSLSDNAISKFTFGSNLEFRPVSTLLLRANYATSFRAPDMNYVFLQKQNGYYPSTTDYWRCEQSGQPLNKCQYANVSPGANYTLVGNKDLKPENGASYGAGFVWSPKKNIDVSLDYWHVKINNLITNLDPDRLLKTEADCRAGRDNIASSQCQDAFARIQRNPASNLITANDITNINVQPINAATQQVSGIDLTTNWRFSPLDLGQFIWSINYTRLLSSKSKQFESDQYNNDLKDMTNTDWRDKLNTSLSWSKNKFASTVLVNRFGKIPSSDGSVYLKPEITVNWSASYKVSSQLSASVIVNNLFNNIPKDYTGGWPYYPVNNYSAYGREAWLEVNYKF